MPEARLIRLKYGSVEWTGYVYPHDGDLYVNPERYQRPKEMVVLTSDAPLMPKPIADFGEMIQKAQSLGFVMDPRIRSTSQGIFEVIKFLIMNE